MEQNKKYTETVKIDKPAKNIYCLPNRLSLPKSLKKPSLAPICFKSHRKPQAKSHPTAPPDSRKPTAKSYRSQNKSTHKNALYLL